jgi:Protein of unknown function (DUF3489)
MSEASGMGFGIPDRRRKDMAKSSKSRAKKTARRAGSSGKGARIIELLRRKQGATLAELTEATHWQPHSVRGFLSAQVSKKMGLKLKSTKREDGQSVYRIES